MLSNKTKRKEEREAGHSSVRHLCSQATARPAEALLPRQQLDITH